MVIHVDLEEKHHVSLFDVKIHTDGFFGILRDHLEYKMGIDFELSYDRIGWSC